MSPEQTAFLTFVRTGAFGVITARGAASADE